MATGIKRFSDFNEKDASSLISTSFIVGYDTVGFTNTEFRIGLASLYQNPLNPLYTILNGSSGNWDSVYSSVNNLSSGWDFNASKGYVHNNFLPLSGGTLTGLLSTKDDRTSRDWNSVYSVVNTNSAIWTPSLLNAFNYQQITSPSAGAQNNTNILTEGTKVVSSGRDNIILGVSYSSITDSDRNTIISGLSSTIVDNTTGSLIIGGSANIIQDSVYSSAINTVSAKIDRGLFNTQIGGQNNLQEANITSFILGGSGNYAGFADSSFMFGSNNCTSFESLCSLIGLCDQSTRILNAQNAIILNSRKSRLGENAQRSAIINCDYSRFSTTKRGIHINVVNTDSDYDNGLAVVCVEESSSDGNVNTGLYNSIALESRFNDHSCVWNTKTGYISGSSCTAVINTSSSVVHDAEYSCMIGSKESKIIGAKGSFIFGGHNNYTNIDNTYLLCTSLTANRSNTVFTDNLVNTNTIISNTISANNYFILKSPNNTYWSITIDNTGGLTTAPL